LNLKSGIGPTAATSMKVIPMVKSKTRRILLGLLVAAFTSTAIGLDVVAQRQRHPVKHPAVCGNPNVSCPTTFKFESYDLPFRMPQTAVIYDTDLFYAVMLRSVASPADNCDNYIPEPDRLAAQILFPNNKVFTSRCAEPGQVSYSNTSAKAQFMAVYAGMNLAEANRMLATVKASGKFPGASIRRMRAMVNGT